MAAITAGILEIFADVTAQAEATPGAGQDYGSDLIVL
jgi:hypothetical protein